MNLRLKLLLDYYFGGLLHALFKIPTILLGKVLGRNHELSQCREIAVIKLLGGGSLVIAYPALLALKRLPQVRKFSLVTTPAIRPFGETLGIFDEIVVIREDSIFHLAFDALRAGIRLFRHDAVIDCEIHSRLTTVFSLLICARNRVGFFTNISFWRRGLSTHLLFCNISSGIYYFYDQIASLFGTSAVSEEDCGATFASQLSGRTFSEPGVHLAVAPTCSGLSRERMLEPSEWLEILSNRTARFAGQKIHIHLFGGPADGPYLERLKESLAAKLGPQVTFANYAGKTKLRESVQLLHGATEVLCIDSALLHFSRLLGLQTISYWGPTDPKVLARPRRGDLDEIHYVKLPCSPCVHVSHQPPCKGHNLCMRLAANPSVDVDRNPPWLLQ